MAVEQVAAQHADRQVTLAKRTALELGRLWGLVDRGNIAASWTRLMVQALAVLGTSQATAAASADVYVDDVLEASGVAATAAGRLMPGAFAGIASDGRPLASLLYRPVVTALQQIEQGAPTRQALATGRFTLDLISRTQIADAGRVAVGTAIAARPQVRGYVRMIVGKTCSRCLILAGRRYSWNQGFRRHPRCLPSGVVVSTPGVEAASRRWYDGELVVLRTAAGHELPVTGNHPVLTDRGWLPANLLREGDYVVRSLGDHAVPAAIGNVSVPHEDQVPTRIEDLWRSYSVLPLRRVPSSAEDFHGDGGYGEVEVVAADGLLRDRLLTSISQPSGELPLLVGDGLVERILRRSLLAQERSSSKLLFVADNPAQSLAESLAMFGGAASLGSGDDALGAGLFGLPLHPQARGVADVAECDTCSSQPDLDGPASDPMFASEVAGAGSPLVGSDDLGDGQGAFLARWDAPSVPFSVESRAVYAARGRDLLDRLAGQVELDRVVEVRRTAWSGHVYNLSSVEGWYLADRIILSNCDCRHIPVSEDTAGDLTTDPKAYFEALSRDEQNDLLGKDGAEAVRAGADLARVVNARRGLQTASIGGQQVLTTTEAAGRRPRLMPEAIFAASNGDREMAVRLLRQHGFIL